MGQTTYPPAEEFSAEQWAMIDEIVRARRGEPGALITVLEEVQEAVGYLPDAVQRRVARGLDLPLGQVYGVVTFYSYFTMQPRGRHIIRVCLGTACHVRGSQRNLEALQATLGVAPGECTPDRHFGLETVRCLGACGLAPVLTVGQDTHRQVKTARIEQVLAPYRPTQDD